VPAGSRVLSPSEIADERMETMLAALSLSYDQVVLDTRDELIEPLAPTVAAALIVSELAADHPLTRRAMARISAASEADVHLLVIDPPAGQGGGAPPRAANR
jgi:hypothetical protein